MDASCGELPNTTTIAYTRARIAERIPTLGAPFTDDAKEYRARRLILGLEAGNKRTSELGSHGLVQPPVHPHVTARGSMDGRGDRCLTFVRPLTTAAESQHPRLPPPNPFRS